MRVRRLSYSKNYVKVTLHFTVIHSLILVTELLLKERQRERERERERERGGKVGGGIVRSASYTRAFGRGEDRTSLF
jgi:hypothetical protein